MTATLNVKVVPGASRDRVAGRYGDGIRVQVAAPPEGGKANKAVIRLLAEFLDVKPDAMRIVRGHTQPRKVVEIAGVDATTLADRLQRIE